MDGAGPVSAVAAELGQLEAAMGDTDRADDMDEIIARYGEVQARSRSSTLRAGGRARRSACWLEFQPGDDGRQTSARCRAAGRCAVALARILLMRPTPCCWTSRATIWIWRSDMA